MTEIDSIKPLMACLVSLAAVCPIILSWKRPNLRETWTFLAGVVKFAIVLSMLPAVMEGGTPVFTVWRLLPDLPIQFRVDGLGLLFGLVASGLWIVTSLYSVGYMRGSKEHAQTRFFAFFAIALSATLGVAFSANLLTMYIFYEILSLSTYPLVTHHQDREARSGGRTYLTYLLGASIGLALPAMVFAYIKSGGSMDFASQGFLNGKLSRGEAYVLLIMFVFGFAKAGLMPLHSWLPGAMVAPTPVSALLHAVAVVKVGVFCNIRIITGVFGTDFLKELDLGIVISWVAAFTVIASSLIALSQDNLKRRLAFSTIGQLAYIILGISLLTPKGQAGSVLHIGMHAVGKITLFFCAGAIYVATGKKYISQMVGIGRQMPITMSMFFIGAISVIGLPPTGGFISKLYLVMGTLEAQERLLLVVFLTSTLLNAAYLLPIVYNAFFKKPPGADLTLAIGEAPKPCVAALVITGVLSIIAFFQYRVLFELTTHW